MCVLYRDNFSLLLCDIIIIQGISYTQVRTRLQSVIEYHYSRCRRPAIVASNAAAPINHPQLLVPGSKSTYLAEVRCPALALTRKQPSCDLGVKLQGVTHNFHCCCRSSFNCAVCFCYQQQKPYCEKKLHFNEKLLFNYVKIVFFFTFSLQEPRF